MICLPDTNIISALFDRDLSVRQQIKQLREGDVGLSVIVLAELMFGALKSHRLANNIAQIEALEFEHPPFTSADARQAAEIRFELASIGRLIGPNDILIAAQARARDLTLVTRNLCEFERVPGLRVEAW